METSDYSKLWAALDSRDYDAIYSIMMPVIINRVKYLYSNKITVNEIRETVKHDISCFFWDRSVEKKLHNVLYGYLDFIEESEENEAIIDNEDFVV